MVRLFEVCPIIWEETIEELERKFRDIEFKGKDITPDWRRLAHRRKIDREIFEKYGNYRDIILHPKFQLLKHYYEEHVDFNLFVGEPMLPITTVVILLFILSRKVNTNVIFFLGSFVLNLNPFYVSLIVFVSWFFTGQRKLPHKYQQVRANKKTNSPRRESNFTDGNDFPFQELQSLSAADSRAKDLTDYDHVLIGCNISTLYAGALLSKNGHRVCILQLPQGPKSKIFPLKAPCRADIEQVVVNKLERYQFLLDCVQSSRKNFDCRVQFTPLGIAGNGYVHSIVNVKHPTIHRKDQTVTLRVGADTLAHELSSIYAINRSTLSATFQKIKATASLMSNYLYSRILSSFTEREKQSKEEYAKDANFQVIRDFVKGSVEKNLYDLQLEHEQLIDTLTALSASIGSNESSLKNILSSVSLGNLINSEFGQYVPRHGIAEIESALINIIEEGAGKVLSNVVVKGLEIEEVPGGRYRAAGVTIVNFAEKSECLLKASQSVISGIGLLGTYATLIPNECILPSTKEQLALLQERKPKVKVIFWLNGEAEELGITSINYFELLSPSLLAESEFDRALHALNRESELLNKVASSYVHVWSPSAQNPDWKNSLNAKIQIIVLEFEFVEPTVHLEPLNWHNNSGPKFFVNTKDDLTNPNHPEHGLTVGGRILSFTASQRDDYLRRAEVVLRTVYPKTANKIIFSHLEEPTLGGHSISNQTEKFASSLSIRTEIERLYMTGSDFAFHGFMGELQGGWLTANAVLGYTITELVAGKNLFIDLYSLSS